MKLYMEQLFRWGVTQELRDSAGRTRYYLTGDAYSLGKRLHVTDLAGREAIFIRQAVPSLFPRYEIEAYGRPVGELVKDLTFSRPRCTIEALGWEVSGSLGARAYSISRGGSIVAVSRPDPAEPERMELDLPDPAAELTALGVMLVINCIFADQESKHL